MTTQYYSKPSISGIVIIVVLLAIIAIGAIFTLNIEPTYSDPKEQELFDRLIDEENLQADTESNEKMLQDYLDVEEDYGE